MTFKEKLRMMMARRKWGGKEVVEHCRTASPSTIARWLKEGESYEPSLSHLEALAEGFGVPIAFWVDDSVSDPDDAPTLAGPEMRPVIEKARSIGVDRAAFILGVVELIGYEKAAHRLVGDDDKPPAPTQGRSPRGDQGL